MAAIIEKIAWSALLNVIDIISGIYDRSGQAVIKVVSPEAMILRRRSRCRVCSNSLSVQPEIACFQPHHDPCQ